MTVIISASELAGLIAGARPPVLLDVRYAPGAPPGRPEYEAAICPAPSSSTSKRNCPPRPAPVAVIRCPT